MLTAHETYQIFHAIRIHFIQEKYDFFRSGGRLKSNKSEFDVRPDRYFYGKLRKIFPTADRLIPFCVATYAHTDFLMKPPSKIWIYDFQENAAMERYGWFKKQIEAQDYSFEQDFARYVHQDLNPFICKRNQQPLIISDLIRGKIRPVSVINADVLVPGLLDAVSNTVGDDFVTPLIIGRLKKLYPFVPIIPVEAQEKMLKAISVWTK